MHAPHADVRDAAQDAFNSGRPLRGVLGYAVVFPLLGFVALRSGIGFLRWRIQRELWRREVDGRTDPADPPDVSAGRR